MRLKEYIFKRKVNFFIAIAIIAVLLLFILNILDTKFNYHDILVEFHGLVYDLLVFGIILTIYETITARNRKIERYKEELDDFRFWESDEAKYRIRGLVKRLYKNGITNLDLSYCYLKNDKSYGNYKKLSYSKFTGATMNGSYFVLNQIDNSEFIITDLSDSYFKRVNFEKSVFSGANLKGSCIEKVNFSDADLSKINLENTEVFDCNFSNCDLTHAKLENMVVDKAEWFEELKKVNVVGIDELSEKYVLKKYKKDNTNNLYIVKTA